MSSFMEKLDRLFLYISCVLTGVNQNKKGYILLPFYIWDKEFINQLQQLQNKKRKNPKCNKNLDINDFIVLLKVTVV